MCIITYKFIIRAKYEMGALGYRPKNDKLLDLSELNQNVVNTLFRLKNNDDAFMAYYHYSWILKHHKKIKKAQKNYKWQNKDITYYPIELDRYKKCCNNIDIVTNMFSKKVVSLSMDKTIFEKTYTKKPRQKLFKLISINDRNFIFTKDYLSTIKRKKYLDIENAVAELELICLSKKEQKYINYITYNENVLNNLSGYGSVEEIKDFFKSIAAYQINSAIETTTIGYAVLAQQTFNLLH